MVAIPKTKPQPELPTLDDAEPVWDIARLFPSQGVWSEWEYLALETNHLVEFTDGYIEVLPMPKPAHQRIVLFLLDELRAITVPARLGEVLMAPTRVRVRKGMFREPDVLFMLTEHAARKDEGFWEGADLVMEVVSPDAGSHERDYAEKRAAYAEGGVAEYWIIDPQEKRILVLKFTGGEYVIHGEFTSGRAESALLPGFSIDLDAVWAAAGG
jgi:Uma2 family endonuclease